MRKSLLIIGALALASLTWASTAFANSPSGQGHNPFDAIWKAIDGLQEDIAAIPAGPPGPQGIQGPPGPAVDKGMTYLVTTDAAVSAGTTATAIAMCTDANDVLLSGGFQASAGLTVGSSQPHLILANQAWSASATNNTAVSGTLSARAFCLSIP
ncbi:MAG: hypothetical protein HY975_03930 [Candidatus Kerfeldbacteria bacterium]|nr:hypothetical protein [Candidatus Kerfeldbacteria bacterium]